MAPDKALLKMNAIELSVQTMHPSMTGSFVSGLSIGAGGQFYGRGSAKVEISVE